jgi:hypothetical protein
MRVHGVQEEHRWTDPTFHRSLGRGGWIGRRPTHSVDTRTQSRLLFIHSLLPPPKVFAVGMSFDRRDLSPSWL